MSQSHHISGSGFATDSDNLESVDYVRASGCGNFALGTVQLGIPYGIANTTGQPDQNSATAIIAAAWASGVRYFDTAQAYGASESVLGSAISTLARPLEARIVSKLKLGYEAGLNGGILHSLRDSLARLRQPSLWGVLLHKEDDLDHWAASTGAAFNAAKEEGLIRHAGVSVYTPERAIQALGCDGIDIVQVPANIFDRRMARAGVFKLAEEMGKQIFIRSIYLQGLALMTPEQVKMKMPFAFGACERFQGFCQRHGLSPSRFAIDHIRLQAPAAKIIIGAETIAQVRENCIQFNEAPLPVALHRLWTDELPEDCIELIDPRMWPATKKIQP